MLVQSRHGVGLGPHPASKLNMRHCTGYGNLSNPWAVLLMGAMYLAAAHIPAR